MSLWSVYWLSHIYIPSSILLCPDIFPWSFRYPSCPPTWLPRQQLSHDIERDKLRMIEAWLPGGCPLPSRFIWHGCLGNKTVRQEAEKRCTVSACLFVKEKRSRLAPLGCGLSDCPLCQSAYSAVSVLCVYSSLRNNEIPVITAKTIPKKSNTGITAAGGKCAAFPLRYNSVIV